MTGGKREDAEDREARKKIGERLKEARLYLGLKQDEVAQYLKIHRTALSEIESGTRRVEVLELNRLAKLYRQPAAYFAGEDETVSAYPIDVAHLARQASALSRKDRDELGRFAEYLRSRAETDQE